MLVLAPGLARGADPVAVLTEIQVRRGQVHVKAVGDTEWSAPKPLQSLRPGDQVRVIGDGRAVLVFTGGRGTEIVTSTNSPYAVKAQAEGGTADRAKAVIGGVTNFLLGQQRERTFQSLSVRAIVPTVIGPRGDTRVRPDDVVFEWVGSDLYRYTVRLIGSQGVIWEQSDLPRKPISYPVSAPALTAGTRYTWELEWNPKKNEPKVLNAQFEVAPAAEASLVRDRLALVETAKGYTPATLALMRAGLLFQNGFYDDARRELEKRIKKSKDEGEQPESALYLLLAHVYERIGLKQQASRAFDEAEELSGR
jgi:hypothetical protein